MEKKTSEWKTSLSIWLPLAGLIFGSYCGGASASGAYAVSYFTPFGGGHMLTLLLIFVLMMAFFCSVAMNFIRVYKVTDYNAYFLALYGLQGENANPILKAIVTIFFDVHTLLTGITACAGTIALFSTMMGTIVSWSTMVTSLIAVFLFAFLTMYGASFLRKFNTALTVALIVCLCLLMGAVLKDRGDVYWSLLGNFQEGVNWTSTSLGAGYWMLITYGFTTTTWGSTLCNFSEQIRNKRDCYGSGILMGIVVGLLFLLTGSICLPYMPEAINNAPILGICQQYLAPWLSALYWVVVLAAVVTTAPTFCFNIGNRFSKVWKTTSIGTKTKFFIIAFAFLIICYFISFMGLLNIVKILLTALGTISGLAVGVPLLISIPRVWRKERAEKNA